MHRPRRPKRRISTNEVEFFKILDNPLVKTTAAHVKPFAKHGSRITAVATSTQDVGANRSERALAIWIAVLLRVYLHTRGAASGPLVEKVWKFAAGEADIDIRVGINGENHFFKVITSMSGPTSFRLRIYSWTNGKRSCDWERFGSYLGDQSHAGIETLPVN